MTDHLSFNAARGPRRRDETAGRDGRRRPRRATLTDRDLAELEALLMSVPQRSPSTSVAADSERLEESRYDREPALRQSRRKAPADRHREVREFPFGRVGTRLEDVPPEPGRTPRFRRPAEDASPHAAPPIDRRSTLARAMRFGATAFSLVALVGVSALLVLLAMGGERPATPTVAESATVPPQPAQRYDAPVVTGSTGTGQDAGRIPAQEFVAPRIRGFVRAADAQEAVPDNPQPAEGWPAPAGPAASAEAASEAASGTEAVAEEPAAPTEVAASNGGDAEPAQPAEPAALTRSARVTTHVNMRAGPDNDAAVVAIVPAGKDVGVVECTRWCEVVYDGQQGFIHRRFMSDIQE